DRRDRRRRADPGVRRQPRRTLRGAAGEAARRGVAAGRPAAAGGIFQRRNRRAAGLHRAHRQPQAGAHPLLLGKRYTGVTASRPVRTGTFRGSAPPWGGRAMTNRWLDRYEALDLDTQMVIDQLSSRYEASLQAGATPSLEFYLQESSVTDPA